MIILIGSEMISLVSVVLEAELTLTIFLTNFFPASQNPA